MYEIETSYKLSFKRNLIFEHCKEAYKDESRQDFDVLFITKDRVVVHAHRVIIALQSNLLKQLEDHIAELKIVLPEYSFDVVTAFIKFAYTGEILLPMDLRDEFFSLMVDMMVDLSKLEDCIMTASDDDVENVVQEESSTCVEDLYRAPDKRQSDDEHCIEDETYKMIEENIPDEEETIEDAIEDISNSPFVTNSYTSNSKSKIHTSAFQSNFKKAIEAVRKGELNTMQSARRYGIPKTTLYRYTTNLKKKRKRSNMKK